VFEKGLLCSSFLVALFPGGDEFEEATAIISNNWYRLTGAVCANGEAFLRRAIPVLNELAGNLYVNRKPEKIS